MLGDGDLLHGLQETSPSLWSLWGAIGVESHVLGIGCEYDRLRFLPTNV